ncbi:t-SNARE [Dacryopinax primogenitus]|uniref:t-SNARE n=1 Tax=Dacryopinax primogenitus (strain DJM 731) TaxID=1858805 RepID=M5GEF5_DACPD|nr:t-SNARE [Dacryopinax primogenitus]EJU05392.1 t-SNARE [Dacryopinax primogenitus]
MDRLAAARAQRNPDQGDIELGGIQGNGGQNGDDMSGFYNEIGAVRDAIRSQLVPSVQRISDLHSRSLNSTDEAAVQRDNANLSALIDETSKQTKELQQRIKALERQGGPEGSALIKRQQAAALKSEFREAMENYQRVEQQYRQRYRERMERQFRIVKPDATPEEVTAVLEDGQGGQGGQIFAQALRNTTRYGESRAAYREVQERHAEVQRIEQTLTELAQLFNDLSILVEEQDEGINVINANAADANRDTEKAVDQVNKAVVSARRARRMRWICFIIIVIILIIIAIILAIEIPKNKSS